jgi:tRNA (adenine22-N1)-methyltransferase
MTPSDDAAPAGPTNRSRLTARLASIAELVPAGQSFADIGTDHALLPIALVSSGKVPSAVAIDNKKQPLQVARKNITEANLQERITVHLGDGLDGLRPGAVQTIVMAGLGVATILRLLRRADLSGLGIETLVVQANGSAYAHRTLRRALPELGFAIDDERLVEQKSRRRYRYFVAIAAIRNIDAARHRCTEEIDRLLGPALRSTRSAVFERFRQHQESWLRDEVDSLRASGDRAELLADKASLLKLVQEIADKRVV